MTDTSDKALRSSNERLRVALRQLIHRAGEELGGFHPIVTLAEEILEMVPAPETPEQQPASVITYDVVAYNESWGGYGDNASKDGFMSPDEAIAYAKSCGTHLNATAWERTKPSPVAWKSVQIYPNDCREPPAAKANAFGEVPGEADPVHFEGEVPSQPKDGEQLYRLRPLCTCKGTAHESASSSGYTPNPMCPVHAENGRASDV